MVDIDSTRVGVLLVLLLALVGGVFLAYFLGIERGRELERDEPIFGWRDEFQHWVEGCERDG